MTVHVDLSPTSLNCTCGPYWSVVPPPPCPYHSSRVEPYKEAPLVPHSPHMSPVDLAALYRRLADALDPPRT
jgi:hypothetical protein